MYLVYGHEIKLERIIRRGALGALVMRLPEGAANAEFCSSNTNEDEQILGAIFWLLTFSVCRYIHV